MIQLNALSPASASLPNALPRAALGEPWHQSKSESRLDLTLFLLTAVAVIFCGSCCTMAGVPDTDPLGEGRTECVEFWAR